MNEDFPTTVVDGKISHW